MKLLLKQLSHGCTLRCEPCTRGRHTLCRYVEIEPGEKQARWRYGHVYSCRGTDADHRRWRILRVQNGWQREQDTIRNGGVEEVGRSELGGNRHGEREDLTQRSPGRSPATARRSLRGRPVTNREVETSMTRLSMCEPQGRTVWQGPGRTRSTRAVRRVCW